jgi:hypothetical protein
MRPQDFPCKRVREGIEKKERGMEFFLKRVMKGGHDDGEK